MQVLIRGVGVILVTVSGAAWRMTAPGAPPCLGLGSTVDLGRCSRRPCGRGGSTPHGLLYPEFQHRPPPPSYQASMQEYRLRLLLLDRDRQSGRMRSTASPPPTYRSNVGSLLSYRSVNLQPSTPPPPPASVIETLHAPPSPGDANLISDDNIHPTMTGQTNNKPSATSATSQQQHPAPSIIKIDDRRRRSSGTDVQNSIPNVSLIDTGNEELSSNVETSTGSSSRLCNATGGVGAATTAAAIPTANSGSKDLVTIVTISGTIEPSATGASRSVYTSSSNTNTPSGSAGGATCTLLNSNSSPLLATVIQVSKAGAQTTPSVSTATGAPL
uniref:Uncharacterized protein n=1 Tax=Anopheles farauti TaxID=69004 RepID=A0A182QY14_9DIPT